MKTKTVVIIIAIAFITGIFRTELWNIIKTTLHIGETITDSQLIEIRELRKKNAELFIKYQKLDSSYAIAQSQNISSKKQFGKLQDIFFAHTLNGKRLEFLVDSLGKDNERLVSISHGSGNVNITGGGTPDDTGSYKDDWVTISTQIEKNKLKNLEYGFEFGIGEVRATIEDENNNKTEVYEVYLQSKRDTSKYLYVGDYRRENINLKPYYPMFDFWNPRLNIAGLIGGRTLEGELSVSLMTFGTANDANNIVLLFPDIGFSSNIKDQNNLTAGIRFNAAHYIPLITNIHIKTGVGFPLDDLKLSSMILRFGIGATI